MGLANNASFHPAQSRYDNAEDPRYADEAREDAIDAECDRIWRDPAELQGALEYHGIKFGIDSCRALVRANSACTSGWGFLIADLDSLVRASVEAA